MARKRQKKGLYLNGKKTWLKRNDIMIKEENCITFVRGGGKSGLTNTSTLMINDCDDALYFPNLTRNTFVQLAMLIAEINGFGLELAEEFGRKKFVYRFK